MRRYFIILGLVAIVVGTASCTLNLGGSIPQPTTCDTFIGVAANHFVLNGRVGSDPSAINVATPVITLTADGGLATYTVTIDGSSLGTFKNALPTAVCIRTPVLADGAHTIAAQEVSPKAQPVAPYTFRVDTSAPSAPVIASTQVSVGGNVALRGTAPADAVAVQVRQGATIEGGAGVTAGAWAVNTVALPSGTHVLTAYAFDSAGNISIASAAVTVTT
jgi:hypothetical protein